MAEPVSQIGSIVTVGSGKGGVGKSTVVLNLALALVETGARVGILDADLFAPNIPLMMNLTRRESARGWDIASAERRLIEPLEQHGLKVMSSAFVLGEATPLRLESAFIDMILRQFLNDVVWGELDFLFVDLPPGTADLQQTVLREYPVAGALVVVTPQDVAHLDARKVVSMVQAAKVPLAGGIENMSGASCPHCGEAFDVFPRAPEERTIWAAGVEKLGDVPLDPAIGATGNAGAPLFVSAPDSAPAWAFRAIADRLQDRLKR